MRISKNGGLSSMSIKLNKLNNFAGVTGPVLTIVMDETGVITEIFYSSVTYDMLKEAVENALK